MKIALTGASGFVGQKLVDALLARGHRLRLLYHRRPLDLQDHPVHDHVETVQGSLADMGALAELMQGAKTVIHCAGLVAAKSDRDFFDVNAQGTRNIAAASHDVGISKFLLVSSMAARQPELSAYAASKLAGEEVLKDIPDLAWDVLRPPAVYGPGDMQILPLFKLLRMGFAALPAGKKGRISVIHVDDLAGGIVAWAENAKPSARIYEIAGPRDSDLAWIEMHQAAAQILKVTPRYVVPPRNLLIAVGYLAQFFGRLTGQASMISPGKMRELCHPDWICHDRNFESSVGWRPLIGFKQGLAQTLAWYQERKYL
jgi:nucleoside-diphosphate-sugar epimerase